MSTQVGYKKAAAARSTGLRPSTSINEAAVTNRGARNHYKIVMFGKKKFSIAIDPKNCLAINYNLVIIGAFYEKNLLGLCGWALVDSADWVRSSDVF